MFLIQLSKQLKALMIYLNDLDLSCRQRFQKASLSFDPFLDTLKVHSFRYFTLTGSLLVDLIPNEMNLLALFMAFLKSLFWVDHCLSSLGLEQL